VTRPGRPDIAGNTFAACLDEWPDGSTPETCSAPTIPDMTVVSAPVPQPRRERARLGDTGFPRELV
jgi:hypothetical protein